MARIDEALALANETGEHSSDAFLHRIRGEILLKRDPANTAPAEEAFLTAIAMRNSKRREALSYARRCRWQSFINRPGGLPTPTPCSRQRSKAFARTPEFPQIAEAQALLAALLETDDGKDRRGSAPTPAQTSDRLWLGGGLVQRFCC